MKRSSKKSLAMLLTLAMIMSLFAGLSITASAAAPYTVTFDMNGHGTQIDPITNVAEGGTAAEPAAPTAAGYYFEGWYTNALCTQGNAFDFATVLTENITLYAKWTTYTKLTVTGFNTDVIADASGEGLAETISNGGLGKNYAFFTNEVRGNGNISLLATAVAPFFGLAASAGNNALKITDAETGTLTFTADTYDKIAVLWTNISDNDLSGVNVGITYEDNTEATFTATVPSWKYSVHRDESTAYNSISAYKFDDGGGDDYEAGSYFASRGMYRSEFELDPSKKAKSISFSGAGEGNYINVMAVSGYREYDSAPAAVTGLALGSKTSSGFTASWNAVDKASYYEVTLKQGGSAVAGYPITTTGSTASFSGLDGGKSYTVEVKAGNAAGLYATAASASITTTSSSGYVTDEHAIMQYMYKDRSFDIQGKFNGEWRKTTYSNGGFHTYLNEEEIAPVSFADAQERADGLKIGVDFVFCDDGKTLQINYTVKNTTANEISGVRLATGADIMIGSDDYAAITVFDGATGFKMVSSRDTDAAGEHAQFNFFGRSALGVTDVATFWTGHYGSWSSNKYVANEANLADTDSGAVWSWQDETIPANETKTFSVKIGIGGEGSETAAAGYFNTLTSLPGTVTLNQGDLGIASFNTATFAITAGSQTLTENTHYTISGKDTAAPSIRFLDNEYTRGGTLRVAITGTDPLVNDGKQIVIAKNLPETDDSGYNTATGAQMRYQYLSRYGGKSNFDIHGIFDGSWKQTTYANAGYETFAKVAEGNADRVSADGSAQSIGDNLTLAVNLGLSSDGKAVKVTYTVTNAGSSAQTVSFGSGADIKIGSDDAAVINGFGTGSFSMTSNRPIDINPENGDHAQFRFYGDTATYPDVTPVDTFWYGHWSGSAPSWVSYKSSATFYDGASSGQIRESGRFDSAASWSWTKSIAANSSQSYVVYIGVSGVEQRTNLPIWAEAAGLDDGDATWNDATNTLEFQRPVELDGTIVVPEGDDVIVDLNGNDVTGPDGAPAISIYGATNITIEGGSPAGALTGGDGVPATTHETDTDYTTPAIEGFPYENRDVNGDVRDPAIDPAPGINGYPAIEVNPPSDDPDGPTGDVTNDGATINGGDGTDGGTNANGVATPTGTAITPTPRTSKSSNQMKYTTIGTSSFDVQGVFDSSWKSTTYANAGYFTYLTDGTTTVGVPVDANGATLNGVTVKISLSLVNTSGEIDDDTGTLVKVTYTVSGTPTDAAKTLRLGTGADIKIGADDCAVIVPFADSKGFSMTSNRSSDISNAGDHAQFNFYGDASFAGADPTVTDLWYGHWYGSEKYWAGNGKTAAYYGTADSISGRFDSAASWHWDGVAAGEYSVLIGVSGVQQTQKEKDLNVPIWITAAGLTVDDPDNPNDHGDVTWDNTDHTLTFNDDVVLDNTLTIPDDEEVIIDLNGNDITGPKGGPAILIINGEDDPSGDETLEIKDSTGGGKLTGGDGSDENDNPTDGGEDENGNPITKNRDTGFTPDGQPAVKADDGIITPIKLIGDIEIIGGDGDDAQEPDGDGGNGGAAIEINGAPIEIVPEGTGTPNTPDIKGGDGGNGTGTGDGGNGGGAIISDGEINVKGTPAPTGGPNFNGGDGGDGGSNNGNGGVGADAIHGSNIITIEYPAAPDINGGDGGNGGGTGDGGDGGDAVNGTGSIVITAPANPETDPPTEPHFNGGNGGDGGDNGDGGDGGQAVYGDRDITINSPSRPHLDGGDGGDGEGSGDGGNGGGGIVLTGDAVITIDVGQTPPARPYINGGDGGDGGDNGGDGGNGGDGLENNGTGETNIENGIIDGGDGGDGGQNGTGGNGGDGIDNNGTGTIAIIFGEHTETSPVCPTANGGDGGNGNGSGNGGNGGDGVNNGNGNGTINISIGAITEIPNVGVPSIGGGDGGDANGDGTGGGGGNGIYAPASSIIITPSNTTPVARPIINGGDGGNGDNGGDGGDGVNGNVTGNGGDINGGDGGDGDGTGERSGNGGNGGDGITGNVTNNTGDINGGGGGDGQNDGGDGGNGVSGNNTGNGTGDINGGNGGDGNNHGGNGGDNVIGSGGDGGHGDDGGNDPHVERSPANNNNGGGGSTGGDSNIETLPDGTTIETNDKDDGSREQIITYPNGTVNEKTTDPTGNETREVITDRHGDTTIIETITDGKKITEEITKPDGGKKITETIIDGENTLEERETIIDSDGSVVQKKETITDPTGNKETETITDGDGNIVQKKETISDPNGEKIIETITDGKGEITQKKETITDPSGNKITETITDGKGNITQKKEIITDGKKVTETITDGKGDITQKKETITDGKEVTETITDGDGKLVKKTETITDEKTGIITEKTENGDGDKTETVTKPNGGFTEKQERSDGVTTDTTVTPKGDVDSKVKIPDKTLEDAKDKGNGGLVIVTIPAGDGNIVVETLPDGTKKPVEYCVVKDGKATVLLDGDAILSVEYSKNLFSDMTNHWAGDAADFTGAREIFKGVSSDGDAQIFDPNSELNRGMVITLLHRLEKEPAGSSASFTDIISGAYYEKAVEWGAENGVITGYSDTEYAPAKNITREELAAMLFRYAKTCGYTLTNAASANALAAASFKDIGSVTAYAREAVNWAIGSGLITGKPGNLIDPQGFTTRAEAATIIQRFISTVLAK